MKNLFCKVKYNGANYYGWNLQPNKNTIVLKLTRAFKSFYDKKIEIHGSGRTDRGVHALGQTFSIKLDTNMKANKIMIALNNHLPKDIEIVSTKFVDLNFHARYLAKSKTYLYKIKTNKKDFIWNQDKFWYIEEKLNLKLIKEAAKKLCVKKDFTSFATVSKKDKIDPIKKINKISITKKDDLILIKVNGSGFLRHMVRKIVATLVEIGKEKQEITIISKAFKAKHSSTIQFKAPANGLYLEKVYYR